MCCIIKIVIILSAVLLAAKRGPLDIPEAAAKRRPFDVPEAATKRGPLLSKVSKLSEKEKS